MLWEKEFKSFANNNYHDTNVQKNVKKTELLKLTIALKYKSTLKALVDLCNITKNILILILCFLQEILFILIENTSLYHVFCKTLLAAWYSL